MRLLVLGGTAWLGGEIVRAALARGHEVTSLARGLSGQPPPGVTALVADRGAPGAYAAVSGHDWDAVIDVTRQPSQASGAVRALAERAGCWVLVSSCSVYAAHDTPGADESAALLERDDHDDDGWDTYGGRKVACEQAVLGGIPDRAFIARAGLIAGPGDHTDRTGYWPLRCAHPASADGAVLMPDSPMLSQVIDVRDLAAWLVESAQARRAGVFNAAGPVVPLAEHLATARAVAGHRGEVVAASSDWLERQGVRHWSGERSLPLWLPAEDAGFMARSTAAAQAAGLTCRPLAQTLEATLEWELSQGPGRPRKAGLSAVDEAALLRAARQ